MPAELAWFLGGVLLAAGLVSVWILARMDATARDAARVRQPTTGTVTAVDPPSVDDLGLRGCTVEYAVRGHRYRIAAELPPEDCRVGRKVELRFLPGMPSDAVAAHELRPASRCWSFLLVAAGGALVVWGFFAAE